jgi:hypothetical protein
MKQGAGVATSCGVINERPPSRKVFKDLRTLLHFCGVQLSAPLFFAKNYYFAMFTITLDKKSEWVYYIYGIKEAISANFPVLHTSRLGAVEWKRIWFLRVA